MMLFKVDQTKLNTFMTSIDTMLATQLDKKSDKYSFNFKQDQPINNKNSECNYIYSHNLHTDISFLSLESNFLAN
jgi:hypothetical protein